MTTQSPITFANGETAPVIKGSHVYLIDGSGYIFRAFHALPPLTRPSDGLPVGAVHGFAAMLWKLLRETRAADAPTHLAVIFDASERTFRNTIYPDYKAHRPPLPEELIPQFPLIRDCVRAFNVACIEQNGYEADDLIATIARDVVDAGGDVTIVSSDKDLMQLVRPGVIMFDSMKAKKIGRDEVFEKFGVFPEKVVDVQALAGDSVDNVPGVPGIGVKTAAELITVYGDLATLLASAHEIKQPKRRERLVEFADQARVSMELVKLDDRVPLTFVPEALTVQEPDADQLLGFLRRMEFTTLTKRIADGLGKPVPSGPTPAEPSRQPIVAEGPGASAATSAKAGTVPADGAASIRERLAKIPFATTPVEIIRTAEQLATACLKIRELGSCALSLALTGADPMTAEIAGIALAAEPGVSWYLPIAHELGDAGLFDGSGQAPDQLDLAAVVAALGPVFADEAIMKSGHDVKPALIVLARHGVRLTPFDDAMLLSYAMDGGRWSHGLDDLTLRHLGHTLATRAEITAPFVRVAIDQAARYAATRADAALRLVLLLKARLPAEKAVKVYQSLERPLVPVLATMEREGISVDRNILSRLSGTFSQRVGALEAGIHETAGHSFNIGSPKQLGELLFDQLKLPGGKKTKSGQWETRAGLLDELAANEELPQDARNLINTMLEWRQLTKLKTTYTDALPEFINRQTDRVHTSYALAATTTGRLSSSDPNLQNIPIRTKEGREIRTAFVAPPGHKLISADYSQIELRILAHIADIPQLKQAFADGMDIHAMTASEMFSVPVKDMPADVRRRAKAINFGIIYGISAFGLANQLGIGRDEAGLYIRTYFERFPGIRDYMETTKAFAHANGFVETVFGRRIHYPEINTRNPSVRGNLERAAINAPIQGSAADIIRRAMIRMPAALGAARLDAVRMLLQVHDELVFEVADDDAGAAIPIIRRVMEQAAEPVLSLSVPLHVDAKAAANWEAAH